MKTCQLKMCMAAPPRTTYHVPRTANYTQSHSVLALSSARRDRHLHLCQLIVKRRRVADTQARELLSERRRVHHTASPPPTAAHTRRRRVLRILLNSHHDGICGVDGVAAPDSDPDTATATATATFLAACARPSSGPPSDSSSPSNPTARAVLRGPPSIGGQP